jgi:hypothetical protein
VSATLGPGGISTSVSARSQWPRIGSKVNHRALTAPVIDSRDFLAAKRCAAVDPPDAELCGALQRWASGIDRPRRGRQGYAERLIGSIRRECLDHMSSYLVSDIFATFSEVFGGCITGMFEFEIPTRTATDQIRICAQPQDRERTQPHRFRQTACPCRRDH